MRAFLRFLAENKIWWITPLLLVLGLVTFLMLQDTGPTSPADEPFVYDLY